MLADNTILLGIIALLNGAYLFGQKNQRADFKEVAVKLEHLVEEFLIVKTEHRINHPEQAPAARKPIPKPIPKPSKRGIKKFIGILALLMFSAI